MCHLPYHYFRETIYLTRKSDPKTFSSPRILSSRFSNFHSPLRKQASNLNPGKDIIDWQSQVSFRRHSLDLRRTFRVDRMKNPIPRCQLELCRFDPWMENRPFSTFRQILLDEFSVNPTVP